MLHPVTWSSELQHIVGLPTRLYNTEIGLNIACVDWYRSLRLPFRLHHSANERKGLKSGLLAKRQGQSKGFPDLIIFGLNLAVELKVKDSPLSLHQSDWLQYLQEEGWIVAKINTLEAFKDLVDHALALKAKQVCKG
jgi:hypothetical protein